MIAAFPFPFEVFYFDDEMQKLNCMR